MLPRPNTSSPNAASHLLLMPRGSRRRKDPRIFELSLKHHGSILRSIVQISSSGEAKQVLIGDGSIDNNSMPLEPPLRLLAYESKRPRKVGIIDLAGCRLEKRQLSRGKAKIVNSIALMAARAFHGHVCASQSFVGITRVVFGFPLWPAIWNLEQTGPMPGREPRACDIMWWTGSPHRSSALGSEGAGRRCSAVCGCLFARRLNCHSSESRCAYMPSPGLRRGCRNPGLHLPSRSWRPCRRPEC